MGIATGGSTVVSPAPTASTPAPHPTNVPGAGQLSPAQFAAQQTAKAQSTYQQYVNYINTNMGRVNTTAVNRQVGQELGAEVSPLLSGLNAQQTAGQNAINSFTSEFANQLGSISGNINSAYNTAEQQQSALDTAIAAQLRGAGTDQANALQASLQQAGQDTSPAAQAAQAASGAAAASFATGSASLSQLLAQGAANASYGAKLPGYAALSGLQATQGLQAQIAAARSQILSDAQKQVPTLENDAINQQLKAQSNQASSLKSAAQVASTNAKNAQNYVTTLQGNKIKAQDATTRAANAQIAASKALAAELKPTIYGGQKSGYFALVPDGKGGTTNVQLTTPGAAPPTVKTYSNGLIESIGSDGSVQILHPANPKQTTPPNLTKVNGTQGGKLGTWLVNPKTGQKVSFTPNGKTSASVVKKPTGGQNDNEITKEVAGWQRGSTPTTTTVNGVRTTTYTGTVSYSDAITRLMSAPRNPLSRAEAIKAANAYYKPGYDGRPYQSVRQALTDTGPNGLAANVASAISHGVPASEVYKQAAASGSYTPAMQQQLVYAINRLYTQDYFKKNPKATVLPANVLIAS